MYQLVNLGLVIGTKLGFVWWCLLSLGIIAFIVFKRWRRPLLHFILNNQTISRIKREVRAGAGSIFFPSVVSGNQGLPVQLEIFEQNLTTRIRSFLRQISNLFKIQR